MTIKKHAFPMFVVPANPESDPGTAPECSSRFSKGKVLGPLKFSNLRKNSIQAVIARSASDAAI
jgi:hypothetical protein